MADSAPPAETRARRRLTIEGIVQGVGFRPFLHRLADELGLSGNAYNFTGGVQVEVEGPPDRVEAFVSRLPAEVPPLAFLEKVEVATLPPEGSESFVIVPSREEQGGPILVSPDMATCGDCRRELADPGDRRYRHPFINCTNCGPRFTIVRAVPYDRPLTSMAAFPMCPRCRAEYENIADRRYHAQPVACPDCGPKLRLVRGDTSVSGTSVSGTGVSPVLGDAALSLAQNLLRAGRIVAVKGLGGFHLACDATNEDAVQLLRRRKGRLEKPLAVMVASLEIAESLVELDEDSRRLLTGPRAPIVLAPQRLPEGLSPGVAPDSSDYGVMLPYTPVHLLLFADLGLPALVMTSGNLSEEPLVTDNAEARERLGELADAFLEHDRDILTGCDDSVVRATRRGPILMRRSRGWAPLPVSLDRPVSSILAVGGHYKNTFCLTSGRHAFLSQHIGDLADADNLAYFERCVQHLEEVWQTTPVALACDLHPDYLSTRYAQERAAAEGLPLFPVQHHHAHLVACLADNHEPGPAVGLICDGTGYGEDGTAWGCEVLIGDAAGYRRWGHLRNIPLPGGERAVREPWRLAGVYLRETYGPDFCGELADLEFCRRLPQDKWAIIEQMLTKQINTPLASSAGRLFDAVAVLLGLSWDSAYEGQPATTLEGRVDGGLARRSFSEGGSVVEGNGYVYDLTTEDGTVLADVRPVIRSIVEDLRAGVPVAVMAARFHETFAQTLVDMAAQAAAETGLRQVALSGGTFQNRLLLERCCTLLESKGLSPLYHRNVPPNDGGMALGQALVAAAQMRR
ncbi:MAG TPA: carbamoyltransferase HypF [Armatimonadota bacterium]|jgi:hydrogenase maturation protein HypF